MLIETTATEESRFPESAPIIRSDLEFKRRKDWSIGKKRFFVGHGGRKPGKKTVLQQPAFAGMKLEGLLKGLALSCINYSLK
jgi:hypothetical protein